MYACEDIALSHQDFHLDVEGVENLEGNPFGNGNEVQAFSSFYFFFLLFQFLAHLLSFSYVLSPQ